MDGFFCKQKAGHASHFTTVAHLENKLYQRNDEEVEHKYGYHILLTSHAATKWRCNKALRKNQIARTLDPASPIRRNSYPCISRSRPCFTSINGVSHMHVDPASRKIVEARKYLSELDPTNLIA